MTTPTEPTTSYEPLGILVIGYLMSSIGAVFVLLLVGATFASGHPSLLHEGAAFFLNASGLVLVVYAHIVHLRKRGRLSSLDEQIYGIPVKYIIAGVTAGILLSGILIHTFDYMSNMGTKQGYNYVLDLILIIPALTMTGILYFNLVFVLVGPFYILGFYLIAVRGNKSST